VRRGAKFMSSAVIRLDQAPVALPFVVHELSYVEGGADWSQRLEELGFLPGERVAVLRHGLIGEPLVVRVGHATYALRKVEAACVLVRPWPVEVQA
jgi:ferrous iron transport protein A